MLPVDKAFMAKIKRRERLAAIMIFGCAIIAWLAAIGLGLAAYVLLLAAEKLHGL